MSTFYDLSPLDTKGQPFSFESLRGKVVLIVNVASKCGFTKQYSELQALNEKYEPQGLKIIGFPCNQFGGQEPGSDEEVQSFCSLNYGVTFPVLQKIEVNGDNESPVYKYLKDQKAGLLGLRRIKWNFEKFLISSTGEVVGRWASTTSPKSLEKDIEKELEAAKKA